LLILALAIALAGLLGCESEESVQDRAIREANAKVMAVGKKLDPLYQTYLTGTRDQAEMSLKQMLSHVEGSDEPPKVQAHDLWLTYSRLYVLEKRGGNEALAQAYLLKARYWLLRKAELGGADAEKAATEVFGWFTPDKCTEIVDHWDKSRTQGKGPNYARSVVPEESSGQTRSPPPVSQ